MNMQNLMAQAQKLQNDITKKKEEINQREYTSENEFVLLTMNGKNEIVKMKIKKDKLDAEDIEVLEDMIAIAVKDINSQITKTTEKELGQYGSALNGLI